MANKHQNIFNLTGNQDMQFKTIKYQYLPL